MENFNQIKNLYNSILNLNLQIAECIEKKDYNEMLLTNNKKNELLAKVNNLKKMTEFSEEEKAQIDKIISEIRSLDNQNIKNLEGERGKIKKMLQNVSKNQRVMNAYSLKKDNSADFLDVKE